MKKLLILILSLGLLSACKSERAGDDRDLQDMIAAVAIRGRAENSTDTVERRNCIEAVLVMNQCVGAGDGFSAGTMCAPSNMNTGTTSSTGTVTSTAAQNYTTLISCVRGKVLEYNCNFSQNRVASAKSAYDTYFKACDVPAGIIISNNY